MDFTVYGAGPGAQPILRFGNCIIDSDADLQAGPDEAVHKGEQLSDDEWYFRDGVKTARPVLDIETSYSIAADGEDAAQFDLPPHSAVFHPATGESWPDEDEFHVTSDDAGIFVYRIEPAFPYRGPIEVTIHAA